MGMFSEAIAEANIKAIDKIYKEMLVEVDVDSNNFTKEEVKKILKRFYEKVSWEVSD